MGFMDSIKERFGNKSKAQETVRQHDDKVDDEIDRAGQVGDDRTGGKHSDQISKGTDRGKDAMGKWSGEGGDDKH